MIQHVPENPEPSGNLQNRHAAKRITPTSNRASKTDFFARLKTIGGRAPSAGDWQLANSKESSMNNLSQRFLHLMLAVVFTAAPAAFAKSQKGSPSGKVNSRGKSNLHQQKLKNKRQRLKKSRER